MEILKDVLAKAACNRLENVDILKNGSNQINFLICSAFDDFEIERRIIQTTAYQKVKQECFKEFGVEIKIIDVKIGLDSVEEMSKSYGSIFQEAIGKNAISNETNCPIILLGNKYGQPQIPYRIPRLVFERFKATIRRHRSKFIIDSNSLDVYYKNDDAWKGDVDVEYDTDDVILVDAREIFPKLIDGTSDEISKIRQEWEMIQNMLKQVFHQLHEICLQEDSLSHKQMKQLFVYELDDSISRVLSQSLDSDFPPIILARNIVDIRNFIGLSNSQSELWRQQVLERFVDTKLNMTIDPMKLQIDHNSQSMLNQLKSSLLEQFDGHNEEFKVLWRDPSGISKKDHDSYLKNFEDKLMERITEAVRLRSPYLFIPEPAPLIDGLITLDLVANSVLQMNRLHTLYWGFEELISASLMYVADLNNQYPMVIYGQPNSGKAIVVAKIFQEVINNIDDFNGFIPIVRFSDTLTSAESLLQSIFHQISAIEQISYDTDSISTDSIPNLMQLISTCTLNFLIVIHDFEKCFQNDSKAISESIVSTLPNLLPPNIKLILTTTGNWDERNPEFLNLLAPEFTMAEYHNFIHAQSDRSNEIEKITEYSNLYQMMLGCIDDILSSNIVIEIFNNHFIYDELVKIKTITKSELIKYLLSQIINKFNRKLIIHFLSFLYYSKSGLTDTELIHILTLDSEVMHELSKTTPNSIIIYNDNLVFPFGLLMKLKKELNVFLIETMIDGQITNKLANTSIFTDILQTDSENSDIYFHKIIGNYYLGYWFNKSKQYFDDTALLIPTTIPQNMVDINSDNQKYFFNYRKFRETVFHLVKSNMSEELLKEIIFNFDWLYNKIKAYHIDELLNDFIEARKLGKEINLLEESLRNSAKVINQDINSLAGELIGQLLPYVPYYPNLKYLIQNCDRIAPKHNAFIPIYPSNKLPGSALMSTISCPCKIESVDIYTNSSDKNHNGDLLLKLKGDYRLFFYDLNQNQIISELLLSHGSVCMGKNDEVIVILESKYQQIIKVHDIENGKLLGQIIPLNWIVPRPFEERHLYRIQQVEVGKNKIAILITNEVSFLFIVNIKTMEMLLAFSPGMKLQMIKLSADESTLFTHKAEKLISLNIKTNELVSAVALEGLPIEMKFFDVSEQKGFVICEKQKGVVVVEINDNIFVNKCYKISFSNCLEPDDYVLEVTCSNRGNSFLLIRSKHSVLLYDWKMEKVLCHVTRPSKLPIYFKLPNQTENQPTSLQFNAAKLILNDRAIACALFRDIIICGVGDNRVLTTLHAPVGGIVTNIFITEQYLVGQIDLADNKAELMIWRTDTNCLFSRLETSQDKLTMSVKKICACQQISIAIGHNSDEMGVFDVTTGTLIDLYSHAAKVIDCILSICGKWALVTVDSDSNSNILWSLESRKIILEFGSKRMTNYILNSMKHSSFIIISNYSQSITEPTFIITQIICDNDLQNIDETDEDSKQNDQKIDYVNQLKINDLGFLISKPLIVNDDKILVFLCRYYNDCHEEYKSLLLWSRNDASEINGVSSIINYASIQDQINLEIDDILSIHSNSIDDTSIFVLVKCVNNCVCLLSLNCITNMIDMYTLLTEIDPSEIDCKKLIVSNQGMYGFDEVTGSVFNLKDNGVLMGQLWSNKTDYNENGEFIENNNPMWRFHCFAEADTVLIGSCDSTLLAWRLPECDCIGKSEMRSTISYGCIKSNNTIDSNKSECILMTGCSDGGVLALALIDTNSMYDDGNDDKVFVERNFPPSIPDSPTVPLVLDFPTTNTSHHHYNENKRNNSNADDSIKLPERPFSDPVVWKRSEEFSFLN